jgi:hypothetical protein
LYKKTAIYEKIASIPSKIYIYSEQMSKLFEVKVTESRGRGLFAIDLIPTGVNILESEPSVYALSDNHVKSRCSYCTTKAEKLSRCAGCKMQWYCGKVRKRGFLYPNWPIIFFCPQYILPWWVQE